MGTIFIIACGLIGAVSAGKQSFFKSWVFLVNFCFSVYIAVFLAPLAVPLLEIPGLTPGIKIILSVGVIWIVVFLILKKIVESVFPGSGDDLPLPVLPAKLGSVLSGVLSGLVAGGLALFIFIQLPFFEMIPEQMQKNFRSSSRKSLRTMIGTVNVFSFQSITPAGREDLRMIGLLPKKKEPAPPVPAAGKPAETDKKE